jgi:glycine/sarcosine N-methyltransferase
MSQAAYDDFSQDYDRFVDWKSRLATEIPFIDHFLKQIQTTQNRSPSILDAACGSGMHAIELAKFGYPISAADLSSKMILKAIENAENAGVEVNLKESGFGNLANVFSNDPNYPFDMVTCLGNSLPHLLSLEKIQKALLDFSDCLIKDGFLILQNRNFDAVVKNQNRWMEPQAHRESIDEWIFLRFYDFNPDGLITFNILRLHRSGDGDWQQRISTTRLFPIKQNDLVPMMDCCGFTDVACFGFMGDKPFDPSSSENLVIVGQKA